MVRFARIRWFIRSRPVRWWLAWALLVGGAGTVWFRSVREARAEARAWGEAAEVVVVRHDVDAGELVAPGDVEVAVRPTGHLPAGALAAVPAGAVARVDLVAGEVLTDRRISAAPAPIGLLAPGELAVAVPVDERTPPVTTGDAVVVLASGADLGDPGAGEVITDLGRVVSVSERTVMVAIPAGVVTRLAGPLWRGAVVLAVSASPPPPRAAP